MNLNVSSSCGATPRVSSDSALRKETCTALNVHILLLHLDVAPVLLYLHAVS
jgi:hypothetical protein